MNGRTVGLGRQRLGSAELPALDGAADRRPVPGRPPPPGAAECRAVAAARPRPRARRRGGSARHRRDAARLGPRPAARPGGPAPSSARRSGAGRPGPVAPQPQRAQRRQRRGLPARAARPVGRTRSVPQQADAGPRHDTGRDDAGGTACRGQRLRHAVVSAVSVSMPIRHAWSCAIEAFSLAGQLPPGQVDVAAASTRCCGARRTWRSRAAPSPSGPDRSGTDAGWCGWRTAARPPPARPGAPPSTRSTRSAARRGCGATPTGTAGPGPG